MEMCAIGCGSGLRDGGAASLNVSDCDGRHAGLATMVR